MSGHLKLLVAALLAGAGLATWAFNHTANDSGWVKNEPGSRPLLSKPKDTVNQPRSSASQPATQPATQPAPSPFLPPEFAIFQSRNAFARGGKTGPGPGPGGPEAAFVLRGVAQAGDSLIAFLEDKAAKHVMQFSVGQTVARGKISSINLDGIVYQGMGNVKNIKVGQDLSGQVVPPTPTSKPAAPPQTGGGEQSLPPGAQPPSPPETSAGATRPSRARKAPVEIR